MITPTRGGFPLFKGRGTYPPERHLSSIVFPVNESSSLCPGIAEFRHLLAIAGLFSLACSAAAQQEPQAAPSSKMAEASSEVEPAALTADEEIVREGLIRHVELLSGKIGERNPKMLWELAEASDYLANELERLGFSVDRQGYETAGIAAQNLAITVNGGARGDEVLVLGAHYDSPPGSRGMNAGATGTAALLEMARLMRDASLDRSLRIVFFALGESPHGDGDARGARHYAEKIAIEARTLPKPGLPEAVASVSRIEPIGMIHLDRLGALRGSAAPGSSRKAPGREAHIRWGSTGGGERLFFALQESLAGEPFQLDAVSAPEAADSDTIPFAELKIPTLSLCGGGAAVETQPEYSEMAQFVMRLRFGIGQLLGETPTNDGMVTPLGSRLR